MTPPTPPPGRLIGVGGQVLGSPPVVAHVLTIPAGSTAADIAGIAAYWQQTLGVPAIVLVDGVELIGHVLADGTLQALPLDERLSAKVQVVLAERGQLRAQADQMAAAGLTPTPEAYGENGQTDG